MTYLFLYICVTHDSNADEQNNKKKKTILSSVPDYFNNRNFPPDLLVKNVHFDVVLHAVKFSYFVDDHVLLLFYCCCSKQQILRQTNDSFVKNPCRWCPIFFLFFLEGKKATCSSSSQQTLTQMICFFCRYNFNDPNVLNAFFFFVNSLTHCPNIDFLLTLQRHTLHTHKIFSNQHFRAYNVVSSIVFFSLGGAGEANGERDWDGKMHAQFQNVDVCRKSSHEVALSGRFLIIFSSFFFFLNTLRRRKLSIKLNI